MQDDIRTYNLSDDAIDFLDELVPDLSGFPMTWGPNLIKWGLQNYIRALDNIFGEHEYTQITEINFSNSIVANVSYSYTDAYGATDTYTGLLSYYPSQIDDLGVVFFDSSHVRAETYSVRNAAGSAPSLTVNQSNGRITLSLNKYNVGIYSNDILNNSDYNSIYVSPAITKTYFADGSSTAPYNAIGRLVTVGFTTASDVADAYDTAIYIPSGDYDYNSYKTAIIDNFNDKYPDEALNPDDFPTFDEVLQEVHPAEPTEPSESGTGGSIYVENNGTIEGDFAAGAFGAGAIGWVDIDGELNAEFNGDVNLDGDLNFNGDVNFNGDLNLSGGDMNFSGNVSFGDVYVQGDTINYDEVLSERELESILNQETYYLAEIETDVKTLTIQDAPLTYLPEKIVETGSGVFSFGFGALSDVGLLSPFVSVAVLAFFVRTFRG